MNKAILMSIRPQYVAKILNGEKTIEIRKKFPKDYVGWVYIYCTKSSNCCLLSKIEDNGGLTENGTYREYQTYVVVTKRLLNKFGLEWGETNLNGKVVARFWCDKVEEIEIKQQMGWNYPTDDTIFETKTLNPIELLEKSCLDYNTIDVYLGDEGYAIHISKLEVFEKPMELREFKSLNKCKGCSIEHCCNIQDICSHALEKAPQSWCYVEVK